MKYIENLILAHRIYEEFKNLQVGTTLERLIMFLKEIKSKGAGEYKPDDFIHLLSGLKEDNNISYGNLEMLRAMQILKKVEEGKSLYTISALGEYIINQKPSSYGFDLFMILVYLDSIEVLRKFVRTNLEVNAKELSEILGKEMAYYNKVLLNKEWKKPFNEPISLMLLDLLVEFRILQKNSSTHKYFL